MIFVTNWVADGAPDAKLPRFCMEFRPESNGTSSGPVLNPKIKKSPNFLLPVQATLGPPSPHPPGGPTLHPPLSADKLSELH